MFYLVMRAGVAAGSCYNSVSPCHQSFYNCKNGFLVLLKLISTQTCHSQFIYFNQILDKIQIKTVNQRSEDEINL